MNVYVQRLLNIMETNTDIIDSYRWKSFAFWEKMFLYFWFASFVGQLYEVVFWGKDTTTIIPFAQPYGLGVVAVIMFVFPLIRKKLINPYIGYFLNVLTTSIVEYLSAFVVVLSYGKNNFWDYSDRFMNLNGYICLESALLFGLLATIFIYCVYPVTEKIYHTHKKTTIHTVFWITFTLFVFDTIYSIIL